MTGGKDAIANQFYDYHHLLRTSTGQSTLSMANQTYVQHGSIIKQHFRGVAVDKFGAGIETLDFANSAESARAINDFVKTKTNSKIKDIVSPDQFDADTRVVLVSAIYFKANWLYKFNKDQTFKHKFYR